MFYINTHNNHTPLGGVFFVYNYDIKSILPIKLAKRRRSVKLMKVIFLRSTSLLARTSELLEPFLNFFSALNKKRTQNGCVSFGAEKRIRTSGRFQAYTRFPIVLLKPLRHLCISKRSLQSAYIYYCIFLKKSSIFTLLLEKMLKNIISPSFRPQFPRLLR